ncbi:MAG: hypothetical protein IJM49_03470 [Firmicutes bacterium]|nr:hypothetical protein [Bacillota bacterium]
MNVQEKIDHRIKICHDAIYMKGAPSRVPHLSSFMTWKIVDAGYRFSEALHDWDLMEKITVAFEDRYGFDCIREMGNRNPIKVVEGFGESKYIIDDENSFISAKDFVLMEPGEYDEVLHNKREYVYSKLLQRRFGKELAAATPEVMNKVVHEFKAYLDYNARINKRMLEEFGVPNMYGPGIGGSAMESVLNTWRGFKGTAIDLRRCPDKLDEVCQQQLENMTLPMYEMIRKGPDGPTPGCSFDTTGGGLAHTLLNRKQYERYYWPSIKPGLELLVEKNKTSYWFCQGDYRPFMDFFQDLPKGHLCIHVELGDIFEMRKQNPNIAFAGGIPMTMLGGGTPQECVDLTKKLIEEVGRDGGLVLSQDKMCSYPKDCTRENLSAICDFVQNGDY